MILACLKCDGCGAIRTLDDCLVPGVIDLANDRPRDVVDRIECAVEEKARGSVENSIGGYWLTRSEKRPGSSRRVARHYCPECARILRAESLVASPAAR